MSAVIKPLAISRQYELRHVMPHASGSPLVNGAQILRVGSEHFAKGGVGAHVPAARNVAVESKAVRYVFHLRAKNRSHIAMERVKDAFS